MAEHLVSCTCTKEGPIAKRKKQAAELPIPEPILALRRIALSLDDGVLNDRNLVRAALMFPPARSVVPSTVPYSAEELPDAEEMPTVLVEDVSSAPWPPELEFESSLLDLDSGGKTRDDSAFASLEAFVGKLYRVTPEHLWYRTSIAATFPEVQDKLRRASELCARLLPAQRGAICALARIPQDRATRRMPSFQSAGQNTGPSEAPLQEKYMLEAIRRKET